MNKTSCKNLIIVILLVTVLLFGYQLLIKKENFTMTEQSNEAVQNIASVYADTSGTVNFNNLNVTGYSNLLPKGGIIAWSGSTIPLTWALCDGTNGTPDLRGKFILGVNDGSDYNTNLTKRSIGSSGGEENHTLSIGEIPSHSHTVSAALTVRSNNSSYTNATGVNPYPGGVTTDNAGGGGAHNNMPPFYVLAYIIKL